MARLFPPSLAVAVALSASIVSANMKVTYPEPFFLLDGDYESAAPVALLEEQNITTSADAAGFMKQKG
ncbi:hypothetical protein Gpo141_00013209, partial [Globisporangium polare]